MLLLTSILESKLKSRFGTMLARRRQSIHGGFNLTPSPPKGFTNFSRNTHSREGPPHPSPRASSGNLRESPPVPHDNRLSALAESPISPASANRGADGANPQSGLIADVLPTTAASNASNGTTTFGSPNLAGVHPPPGPPPHRSSSSPQNSRDSEGFIVRGAMNDPISQAQHDAAMEAEQHQFKLDIRRDPIPEQDADAQTALSNVANTLRHAQSVTPSRKLGTVRGRRDVRNTIYVPNSLDVPMHDHPLPPSPGIAAGRAAALASLSTSEHAAPAPIASDTTSIRSGHSLTTNAVTKHADMHQPGLNASIIETVSATFENGTIQTAKVSGEVALVYNKVDIDDEAPPSKHMIFTCQRFDANL
jgi:hypothetical protein